MTLYACGSNGSGQLGVGHTDDLSAFTPIDLAISSQPQLSGGGNHTVIVCKGNAFISGTVGTFSTPIFEIIDHPLGKDWMHCASGWEFSILGDDMAIYAIGNGNKGELGLGALTSVPLTKIHQFDAPIKQICCGLSHTVVCLENGHTFGWGYNRQLQLGIPQPIVDVPTRLPVNASQIACGRDFTLLIAEGEAIGLGKKVQIKVPDAVRVYSGWSFYGIETSAGMEWHGNNTFGQTDAPKVSKIALGSEHGLGIKDSTVVTWGWGEHGNCPDSFPIPGEATVYGGCATSWIWT